MKKNSKIKRIFLYAIIASVLIVILYSMNTSITGNVITNSTDAYDYSRERNPEYYSLLPPMPSDFKQIKLMWELGIIRDDPERINESYWKQPEWFPLYSKTFLPTLEYIAKSNRLPIWSLGIFESQSYRIINSEWAKNATEIPKTPGHGKIEIKNDSIILKHRFWLRAAPGAVKIYGVGLSVVYPPKANFVGTANVPPKTVEQDPELTKKYIKAKAYEKESGKSEFNLGTYFPKLSPDYIKEIEVEVEIKRDIPKGFYIVGVNAGAPSREYQEKQSLKYLLKYTDPNIGMFRGPSEYRLFIEVI